MKPSRAIRLVFAGLSALAISLPASVFACAACYGQSDSPMARGMNAGIFALLTVITSVLVGVAIFFAYILRRAARLTGTAPAAAVPGGVSPFPGAALLGGNLAVEPLSALEDVELAVAENGHTPRNRCPARSVTQPLSQPTH